MVIAYPCRANKMLTIPAVLHVDNTSRIQTVDKKHNPKYYKLIREFERLTKIPMLLNTSFNDQEPIVCTPKQAIDTFTKTNIDALAIGHYLLQKR
jgi:carbamoyltransferase